MTVPTVEDGVRAWLGTLPPNAGLNTELEVSDLAPHLSQDPLETVRLMETAGLAKIEVLQRCPECSGLGGVHVEDHSDVDAVEILAFKIQPERLMEWVTSRLRPLDVEITVTGMPVVLQRAVEADARIDAPLRPGGPGRREVRLRLGMGGNEAPLVIAPGREYLRLRFGGAVDLGADRRVIDIDLMRLLGSPQQRIELRERLRRRLHGLQSLPLITPGSKVDQLDGSQILEALRQYLDADGRYAATSERHLWQALAQDWGVPADAVRMQFQRSEARLLACDCDADVHPHMHAFSREGDSVDALVLEPSLRSFRDHQHARTRDLLEFQSVQRHLRDVARLGRAGVALLGTFAIGKVVLPVIPALAGVPTDAIASAGGVIAAVAVLNQPLRRFAVLFWRVRSGSWKVPARRPR